MKKIFLLVFAMLLVSNIDAANAQLTTAYCIDNRTVQLNITVRIIAQGEDINTSILQQEICPFRCDNATGGLNDCNPDPTEPTLLVIATPLVLFFIAFMLLYIAINVKQYKELQFLFLGVSLFVMITNIWFIMRENSRAFATGTSNVLSTIYLALIAITIFVIFYFILSIIIGTLRQIEAKKKGLP